MQSCYWSTAVPFRMVDVTNGTSDGITRNAENRCERRDCRGMFDCDRFEVVW